MKLVSPPASVVILVWNNLADTLACLKSVSALRYPNFSIVVVDNGSEGGVVEAIRAAFPTVTILALAKNVGFSAGNNVGLWYALERGAEYVLLLNNDTVVDPGLLDTLISFAETNPAAGLVGPAVYELGGRPGVFAAGGHIRWAAGHTWISERSGNPPPVPEQVDFVPGCALLASRRFMHEAGLLDPDYFFNFEDAEWAARGRRFHFGSWLVPQASVWHKVSSSLGGSSPANTYYMTRNGLRFFWHNAPRLLRPVAVLRILLRTLRTVAAWSLKPIYRDERFRCRAAANLLAIRDFMLSRFGVMRGDVARACRLTS